MVNCATEVLNLLEIPYQIVLLSTGDMGFSAEKTYDIEAWIPSEKNTEKSQVAHLVDHFKRGEWEQNIKQKDGNEFVSTLNGSGLAVGRLIIALLENNQNEDGSVTIQMF